MVVLATCKNEEDPIKNEGARVLTTLNILKIFRCSRAANSAVSGGLWPNFKLIHTLMVVLITCKNEEDPIKTEDAGVLTTFSSIHYKSMVIFPDAQGQLTPQSLVRSSQISNLSEIL